MLIFYKLSNVIKKKSDKLILVAISILSFVIIILSTSQQIMNTVGSIVEMLLLFLYFAIFRNNNKKIILGSIFSWAVIDAFVLLFEMIFNILFPLLNLQEYEYLENIVLNIFCIYLCFKYADKFRNLLTNENSSIFIGIQIYLYISIEIVASYLFNDHRPKEVIQVSLGLLILQTVFAILVYIAAVRTQKNLLTKQEQKQQKVEAELAKAENKALLLREKSLEEKRRQLQAENNQLKEYSEYLDKNEDELRRFKHDYQNILNGLKISAQEGNVQSVVDQLDKYTNTQFDQKALRKYKGVNHIHVEELKSIAIAKLAKLYNLKINYSFGCDKEIDHIPYSVDMIDLSRIIGIAFDNAAEESQALIAETHDPKSAKVDAMYYQEDGDFEFEIRNRVRNQNVHLDQISKKNFTTKKHHMGLGLTNVKEIAHKYESSMLIDYGITDGWFTFNLTILPDEVEEE